MQPSYRLNRAELARIQRQIRTNDTGCWIWQGRLTPNGYGRVIVRPGERERVTHRVLWENTHGPIPDGLQLDHLCKRRDCCNPDHLEPVTQGENIRRQDHANRRKEACPQGHPYTPENTYVDKKGRRNCQTCKRASRHAHEIPGTRAPSLPGTATVTLAKGADDDSDSR